MNNLNPCNYRFLLLVFMLCIGPILRAQTAQANTLKNKSVLPDWLLSDLDQFLFQLGSDQMDVTPWLNEGDNVSKEIFSEIATQETSALDSLSSLERTVLKFYPLDGEQYVLQLASYKKSKEADELLLIWTLHIDHKAGTTFCSPLNYYTKDWQVIEFGAVEYYFPFSLNETRAKYFADKNKLFADKFDVPLQSFKFYMSSNYQEILRLLGIDYSSVESRQYREGLGIFADQYIFSTQNNEDFSHDLFHHYANRGADRNFVSEEGLAYLWGNAYYTNKQSGEMAEQAELVKVLKTYYQENPELDFYELFVGSFFKDEKGIFNHLAPDFNPGRVVSGIICAKIENDLGMKGVNALLDCKNEPDRFSAFLRCTDELIGLNKENFHEELSKMILN